MTCHTLEEFYHIDGHTFEKQYKEVLSGFRQWEQLEHADEWLLFPDNIGPCLAIDESSLSNGELYTFVTNREARTREQSLVAVVAGTKAEDVITVLQRIDEERRNAVEEVTLDLSDSMRKIVRTAFPKACRVIDRFHIQRLACDAVQELRIKHRWDAIQQANDEMEEARQNGKEYIPYRYHNGDTRKELLIRSRYLLFKSADKWTDRQKQRAAILFEEYPNIKTAYGLCHSLRMIFAKNTIKDAARLSMARWYNKVEEAGFHSFNVIAATFYEHYDEISTSTTTVHQMRSLNHSTLKSNSSERISGELLTRSFSYSVLLTYLPIPTEFLLPQDIDNAAAYAKSMSRHFDVPVMIVETGYSNADEVRAEKVMKELMARMTGVVSGVFYWEPEIYGGWDHTYWEGFWHTSPCVFGKKVVNNGAFTEKGEPSAALRALTRTASVADTSGMIHDMRD